MRHGKNINLDIPTGAIGPLAYDVRNIQAAFERRSLPEVLFVAPTIAALLFEYIVIELTTRQLMRPSRSKTGVAPPLTSCLHLITIRLAALGTAAED